MFVCKIWLDIHILSQPASLKEKRQVMNRIKDRVWNKFRVSVAEVGHGDLWQRAEIGIAFVTSDANQAQAMQNKILQQIEGENEIEVSDIFWDVEILK